MDDTKPPMDEPASPEDREEQIIPLDETPPTPERIQARIPFAKHLTFRQRKIVWRVSIALCLLALIILVIPGSLPIISNATTQLYDRLVPPPTPTLSPNLDSLYFDVNIPWTQVFIDGRAIQIPGIGSGSPIKLAIGKHIVRWQAPPFQTQSCTITVPIYVRISDTCILSTYSLLQIPHLAQAQLLVLHESVNTLANDRQYTLLIQAVRNALTQQDTSTIVQPGEVYDGSSGYDTAYQPLRATLHFSLDLNASSALDVGRTGKYGIETYTINAQDCQILCSIPWQIWLSHPLVPIPAGVSSPPTWFALTFAAQRWDFATPNGHYFASSQPPVTVISHPVVLGISWDGTNWHIQAYFKQNVAPFYFPPVHSGISLPFYANPACADAVDELSQVPFLYSQIQYFPAANVADGCLAIAKWSGAYGPAPSSPYLWFLDRLGILSPANTAATQESGPASPQLNPYEQRLVQHLSQLTGVMVSSG